MRVLAFGTFDPLHEGHRDFFRQAKALGTHLTVVVARDSWVGAHKGHAPHVGEKVRWQRVAAEATVDEARLGDEWPAVDRWRLLGVIPFDVLALGYDQEPADDVVREALASHGRRGARLVRCQPYQAERYKSSRLKRADGCYDLHLHSTASDGDLSPRAIVREAAARHIKGIILTDHNGVWGAAEAASAAASVGIQFATGIEISARWEGLDVHVLGYSRGFRQEVLRAGLKETRRGYAVRIREMIQRCTALGYDRVTWEAVQRRRASLDEPVYVSYDVARLLTEHHGITADEARRLTTGGGLCYVPYGAWALSLREAAELLHMAGGVAVLAHPGLVALDSGQKTLERLLAALPAAHLDGVEVFHPYHDASLTSRLLEEARQRGWLVTGGSDWHGPGRYEKSDEVFGKIGVSAEIFAQLLSRLEAISASS